jgi:DNA-binding helix-hairpin-helix protein with protein kinase domain
VNEPASREEKLELGVELLAHLEHEEMSLAAAIDRIETVTTSPALTRDILDAAEKRGVIEREDARLRVQRGGTYVNYDSQVTQREGEFECRRCGTSITTGHFVKLDAGELGPFGSSCIRKVTGRDSDDE